MRPAVHAVVPARAGSRRLRDKNLRRVAGLPLLAWAVRQGRASRVVDEVVVSTDSARYAALARGWGARVPGLRPARLAAAGTSTAQVLRDLAARLAWRDDDAIVLLQPTSPLRRSADIRACVRRWRSGGGRGSVVSVRPARGAARAAWAKRHGRVPTRDGVPNGAVYVVSCGDLRRHGTLYAPPVRSYRMPAARSVDVDDARDLACASAGRPGV